MAISSLVVYIQMQHGKVMGGRQHWVTTALSREPHTYRMNFPTAGVPQNWPIEGYPRRAVKRTAMRVNLFHWHGQNTVIILEEGKSPTHGAPNAI